MAKKISCKSTQIETNLIVPPETTSPQKNLHRFLVKRPQTKCKKSLLNFKLNSIDVSNPDVIIKRAGNCLDVTKCRQVCRLDKINSYLWELIHPGHHVNFI